MLLLSIQLFLIDPLLSISVLITQEYSAAKWLKLVNVVACSGYSGEKEKEKAFQIGMADYLEKPLKRPEVERMLKQYMNWSSYFILICYLKYIITFSAIYALKKI